MMIEPTVFLVDHDAAVRDALSLLISLKGLRAVVFASAEDFLEAYSPECRGCLLTDLQMPGMQGLEFQRTLAERNIPLPLVVLTVHGDVAITRTALQNGAVDFLEKPLDDDDLLIDVLRNAFRIDEERCRAATPRTEVLLRLQGLTSRERDLLKLLAEGLQQRDIVERLGIRPRMVEIYKDRIAEKLRFRSVAEIVHFGRAAFHASRTSG
jgi:FixJ family two-component response regulator